VDPNTGKFDPITPEMGETLASSTKADKYMEVSAKTREGLEDVFKESVKIVLANRQAANAPAQAQTPTGGVAARKQNKKKSGGCTLL